MKKILKKWSAWVCGAMMLLCLGFGVGLATVMPAQEATVTASAATTYSVEAIRSEDSSSAQHLYITPKDGDGNSFGAGNWDDVFAFRAGSGTGLTLNGNVLATKDIKQPGSFFINLQVEAVSGDVLILDGIWAYGDKEIKFTNCALRYNGSAWDTCKAVALGSLTASGDAATLTLTSNKTLTAGANLTLVKGGIYVNDEDANSRVASIKTTANGVTFTANMEDAVADVVHVKGLLTDGTSYYAVLESYFMWEGTQWRALTGYGAIISKAAPKNDGQTATGFYLSVPTNLGIAGDWNQTTLLNGHGLKLNGQPLVDGSIKFVSATSLYVDVTRTAKAGDVLTINGLYQHSTGCKVLFAPTQALRYNGTTWECLGYTTYDLDEMTVASSQAGTAAKLYLTRKDAGWIPVNASDVFTCESGVSVKKNGMEMDCAIKSVDGCVVLEFDDVNVNDVISIGGGTFVCDEQQVRYALSTSHFKWNGSAWENSEAYVKTEIELINVNETENNRKGFFVDINQNVGISSWDVAYTLVSGAGFMLNGEVVDGVRIKPLGSQKQLYVDVESISVQNGDVLTIDGTFMCKEDGATSEIIFTKTQALTWNGMRWDVDGKTTYIVGSLNLHANSSVGGAKGMNNVLYLQRVDGEALPILNWDYVFVYENGDGFKVNEVQKPISVMKSTGDGMYWEFDGVARGDVVSVGGSFVCEAQNVRYIIEESYFDWDGSRWSADVVYTAEYTIDHLQPTAPSTSAGTTSAQIYLKINGGTGLPVQTWEHMFTLRKGDGLLVNGVSKPIYEMKSAPEGLWLRFDAVSAGDIVSLSGTFVSKTLYTKYEIVESSFKYDGSRWLPMLSYSDEELEDYDVVTNIDFGWGLQQTFNGVQDWTSTRYTQSEDNTTGSIKFRFDYYSGNVASDVISIRMRPAHAWDDTLHFRIINGGIEYVGQGNVFNFANGKSYEVELGAISVKNSSVVWTYIKVDGVLVGSLNKEGLANTNNVSIYVENIGGSTTITDSDHVQITYSDGSAEYAEKNGEYQLIENANATFIGWVNGTTLYQAGETINVGEENMAFTAFVFDFVLKEGAAIRLSTTVEDSGIRFTPMINTQQLNSLTTYGVKVSFGTLIMPYDYLSAGQAPNLEDFAAGSTVLQIPNTVYTEINGAYTEYYGAMKKLYTQNYARDFAGRGYMVITYTNGMTKTIYTPFNAEDNVRSVRTVAQKFMEDEANYEKISAVKKAVVQAYATSPDYGKSARTAAAASVQEGYAAAYVYSNKQNLA